MSRLTRLCDIQHDIEASTSHILRGLDYSKRLAESGPTLVEEMTMHLRWVGNHYTIVVDCDAKVSDLKIVVFQALHVQPQMQKMLDWNIRPHALPGTDNTLLKDFDFQKDMRIIQIGKTFVRLMRFHTQMRRDIIPLQPEVQFSTGQHSVDAKKQKPGGTALKGQKGRVQ